MTTNIDALLKEAVASFNAMSSEAQADMLRRQRESYVRAEMSWPAPKYRWENGAKVYESYADYCA